MKRRILLISLICLTIGVVAQEHSVLKLSLQQAQDYAIEHNKSLKNVRTDVAISKQKLWQTIAQGLPQGSATVDYTNFFNYEIEFGMGGSGSTPTIDFTKLDDGDLQILSFLQQSMGSGTTTIKMKNSSSAKLQVTQLIFSGQYFTGIQIAKVGQMLTDLNVVKSEIDIRESVISTYYLGLLTQKSLEIIDANLENLNKTLIQTTAMLNAGIIEETDVDQLVMSINMLENTRRSLLRNIELNNNIMQFILGIDGDVTIELTESFENILKNMDVSDLLVSKFTPADNITIQMMDKQTELTVKMLDLEKWNYAPTIAGVYSHNEKLLTTDFDMNPKNLFSINMSIPLFSSGIRHSKVEQKKLELYQIQNNREIISDQLLMQEKQLRYNLTSALEQYESQKANMELAQRIYNNTELKFRQGVASSFDLIQANSNLLQAQNGYISAAMELMQSKLKFDKLLNKI
ncbi:MAG TPA: TolC family protein [Bacteroidales bacterium]|nr:TolC family protein [Bacteroidales bacterium]